jgi:uncharacterized membrane protein
MYLLPQTSSHVHMLVGVFPTFGLLLVLGFYIGGLHTKNEGMKRVSLLLIAAIGILSVPTYLSGEAALTALSGSPRIAKDTMASHTWWGMAALIGLMVTGLAALVELVRSRHASAGSHYLTLGIAVAGLALTAVAGEIGFEASHRELQTIVVIPDVSTPAIWPHVHMILNHVPTAGFVFALVFYLAALVTRNDGMVRGSLVLFILCSIVGVPTYVTGTAAMWALTQPPIPEISKAVINAHRDMALWTLFGLAFTGGAAWIELWRQRHLGRFSKVSLAVVLLFALATLGVMTETGHRGGLINHPEIRTAADVLPSNPDAGVSMALETQMKSMIWFLPWQIVHFFGYCLIFASVAAVSLRVLGFWKSASFASMHRILVLGFFGVLMNVVSGMLMMLSDSYRYVVSDVLFGPKVALIPIAAAAVLYFSVSDRVFNLAPGEAASGSAKWIALAALLASAGVIACGRLLPYL